MLKNKKISVEDEAILDNFFSLKEEEKYQEAFDLLKTIQVKYPGNYKIFFLLGSVLYQNNEFKKSLSYLKKAVELNPTHSLSSLTLIHALGQLNRWHMATNELRRFFLQENGNIKEHLLLLRELFEEVKNFSTSEQEMIKKLVNEFDNIPK